MQSTKEAMDRYEGVLADLSTYKSVQRGKFRCRKTLEGVPLQGRRVLEIGAGQGILSAYALAAGAAHVTAVEPEAAGSTDGFVAGIHEVAERMGTDRFEVRTEPVQEFEPLSNEPYDVVIMYNSINHLDEPTCMRLHESEEARQTYRDILACIAGWTAPESDWMIADCSRYNVWPLLHLKSPFAPTIEWEKHQSPKLWTELLAPLGLTCRKLEWYTFYPLRHFGRLLANRPVAYAMSSHFRMLLKRE